MPNAAEYHAPKQLDRDWWHFVEGVSLPPSDPRHVSREQLPLLMALVYLSNIGLSLRISLRDLGKRSATCERQCKRIAVQLRQRNMVKMNGAGVVPTWELVHPKEWLPQAASQRKLQAPSRTLHGKKTRDGIFALHIPGHGVAKAAGDQEITIGTAHMKLATIRGAAVSSLRIPETAEVIVPAAIRLEPEPAKAKPARPQSEVRTSASPVTGSIQKPSYRAQVVTQDTNVLPDRLSPRVPEGTRDADVLPSPPLPSLPEWIPVRMFLAYKKMRRTVGRPLTDDGVDLVIRDLAELRAAGEDVQAVLEQSIKGCHLAVFAVRREKKRGRIDHNERTRRNLEAAGFKPAA